MTPPWKWFLACAVVLSVVYGVLPDALWKEPLYDVLVTSAFVGIWVGIAWYRPAGVNQWALLLGAMGAIGVAEWIWFANDVRGINPFPGWAELFDLGGRVLLLVALARLSGRRGQFRDRMAMLDATVVGFAVAALSWTFVFGRYFDRSDIGVLERLTSSAYLILDLSLLVGFILLLFDVRRAHPALRLLATGIGVVVGADLIWLTLLAHNRYSFGGVTDALWPIGYCCIAAAALHPTMTELDASHVTRERPGLLRFAILPCAVVALPTGGLIADILSIKFSRLDDSVVGFGTLAIAIVVGVRFFGLMRSVEHAADERGRHRTEALVRESLDIVGIVGANGRVKYVSPPIERVLGWSVEEATGSRLDSIVLADERALAIQYFARVVASPPGTPHTFTLNILSRDGTPLLMEIDGVNRLDDPEINGVIVTGRDISERARLEKEVEYYALHDRLTRLANRTLLLDHIDLIVRQRGDGYGAVFVLDLDDFKSVNDSLGHAAGDELLVSVGERLRTCVRPGDTLARLGGDEFALFFLNVERADVDATAQRLLEVLNLPLQAGEHQIAVSASIGIRLLEADDSAHSALHDADIAMYAAKWDGKGGWRVFDAELGAKSARRVALVADLPGAWARHEMEVVYQPIVEMPSGELRGAEALLRWTHPDYGRVSPEEFIRLAEESGVVRELGLEVMREATRNASRWRAGGVPGFYISVNVSPVQLDDALPDIVGGILAAAGLDGTALLVEITENVVLSNVEASLRVLDALRARGIRIAIDDFGTGYSSLAYAQRFPIDLVKIDQSFTRELHASHTGMVSTIVQLAGTMGAKLVAEGVETAEQVTELVQLGCILAQGFLYSPPVHVASMNAIVGDGVLVAGAAFAREARATTTIG